MRRWRARCAAADGVVTVRWGRGPVRRPRERELPPRVEYELTALGRTLFGPIAATCDWTREQLSYLLRTRAAYEVRFVDSARRSSRQA